MQREKFLLIFEFPPGEHEWQLRDLAAGLSKANQSRDILFCCGFYKRYESGGLRPLRILNGVWVHLRSFFTILFGRFDHVIVRTSPPLIQMTVALVSRLRGVRYGVWLMDAHPELEDEIWAQVPVVGALCRLLVRLNKLCLAGAEFVVVLDEAMGRRLVPNHESNRIIICPTWGATRLGKSQPLATLMKHSQRLKFIYLGNLGAAHDVSAMCQLLSVCAKHGEVALTFIGTSPLAVDAVACELRGTDVHLESLPGIPFEQLDQLLPVHGFDFGIVTLKAALAGLLSPSKYIGYLVAGIPLIYLGPPSNNAAKVCDQFEAGLRLSSSDFVEKQSELTVGKLKDLHLRLKLRRNTAPVLQYFDQFDGEYLAAQIELKLM